MDVNKKKQQQILAQSLNKGDWEHSAVAEWLIKHGKTLLWLALVIIIALFFVYYWTAGRREQAEDDFVLAIREMNLLQSADDQGDALEKLTAILRRYPELEAKYDGRIAQSLINQNEVSAADPFAVRNIQRISDEPVPNQIAYSKITLLIDQQKYQQALNESKQLKEKAIGNQTLYAMNLIRIALLQNQLGLTADSKASWEELQNLDNAKAKAVIEHFNEKGITLEEYIKS